MSGTTTPETETATEGTLRPPIGEMVDATRQPVIVWLQYLQSLADAVAAHGRSLERLAEIADNHEHRLAQGGL